MSAYQVTIRDAAEAAISAAAATYVIPDFNIESTYYPTSRLEDIGTKPEVKLSTLGMGIERSRSLRDPRLKQLTLSVIVHVYQRISPDDTEAADQLIEFVEQVMETCEADHLVPGVTWQSTDPMKDEDGAIYDFEALAESGVLRCVFLVNYTAILQ
jgi:hypothetical protein